jgi:hypothetical protein
MTPIIDLKPLKRWANRQLLTSSSLRRVIAAENDELSAEDLVSHIGLYLKLVDEEQGP